jgi:glyoxylase-like metal-dependent hydrolase (beta-lactamase superfamily II)
MEPGDVASVDIGDCESITYVDTGMYDVSGYGSVYVVDAPSPAVVDTGIGADYDYVRSALDAAGIGEDDLEVIALTHVHLDHAGGAGKLIRDYPNAEVYVHGIGAPHLDDPGRLVEGTKQAVGDQWKYYDDPVPVPEARIVELSDGDAIDLGDRQLIAHHAPGHAPHQVIFHSPADDAVFTADAAGIYVPERDAVEPTSPPPNFDPDQALADVETIRSLEPSVLCYAHFGPALTADHLEEYETVLSEWIDAVAAARAELDDEDAVVQRLVEAVDTDEMWGEEKADAETAMNVRGVLHALDRAEEQSA